MKRFLVVFVIFLVSISIGYLIHSDLLQRFNSESVIALDYLYLFLGGFSALLLIQLYLLSKNERYNDQLGFFYLLSVALKLILFSIVFKDGIFTLNSFTNEQSVNLLIPIGLTLFFEVLILSRILNKKDQIKNIK